MRLRATVTPNGRYVPLVKPDYHGSEVGEIGVGRSGSSPGVEPKSSESSHRARLHYQEIREFIYFRNFLSRGVLDSRVISDADVDHYAKAYAAPNHLHAGMEMYRAFPINEKFNAGQQSVSDLPIVLVGGDHSLGKLMPKVAEALRTHGCANVTVEIINSSAHYVFEENPNAVAELIGRYASR